MLLPPVTGTPGTASSHSSIEVPMIVPPHTVARKAAHREVD